MFTLDQVIALAPDAASIKAGRGLGTSRKWSALGANDEALWGLAQGSGKKPYFTQIHLPEPAFKCSCPSRKFPCKHAIGLMFIAAGEADAFTEKEQPEWVTEWLGSRNSRAEKKAVAKKSAPDAKAAAKRKEKKHSRIDDGVEHLEQVLKDFMRNGLAGSRIDQSSTWENLTKRMLDAQASGLAGFVRGLETISLLPDWETKFIHTCGSIHLLLKSWKTRDNITPELKAEVEQLIGLSPTKEEILANKSVSDTWHIISRKHSELDRLSVCQTWLYGQKTKRWAKKLSFTPLPQKPHEPWSLGSSVATDLAFYPGVTQTRALPSNENAQCSLTNTPPPAESATTFAESLDDYAALRAQNPWHRFQPLIANLSLTGTTEHPFLVDKSGHALPAQMNLKQQQFYKAITGNHPTLSCCEWNGYELTVLSAESEHQWIDCP